MRGGVGSIFLFHIVLSDSFRGYVVNPAVKVSALVLKFELSLEFLWFYVGEFLESKRGLLGE